MYEEGKKLLEEISARGTDYELIITEYSWWKSKKERLFVIVWIYLVKNYPNGYVPDIFQDTVALLEKGKGRTEKIPWQRFIELIEKGELIKINDPD